MKLIEKFHKMETDSKLFELGKELKLPIWDIIRYHVYVKYYYSDNDRKNLSTQPRHKIREYFGLLYQLYTFILGLLFRKGENIILSSSRYLNGNGKYFDKSIMPIIDVLGSNYLVMETILRKKVAYHYIYNLSAISRRFFPRKNIPSKYFAKINDALNQNLGENRITHNELNKIYSNYLSDYCYYKFIFRIKRTKRLIISTGNPKASLMAAKDLDIKTYLVQHAGIELDEVDYSYPKGISQHSNILFPNYVLTFGDYWCKNINVPAHHITPIGNDYFYLKPNEHSDESILIISTIIHGGELRKLTIELANQKPGLRLVYKLHPNEFHLKSEYVEYFRNSQNVKIITTETDTNTLIAKSQLVILIVSAVLYEALNQNKKVAILKKLNYKRQLTLLNFSNIYFFDSPKELPKILSAKIIKEEVNFYKPTDFRVINRLLND